MLALFIRWRDWSATSTRLADAIGHGEQPNFRSANDRSCPTLLKMSSPRCYAAAAHSDVIGRLPGLPPAGKGISSGLLPATTIGKLRFSAHTGATVSKGGR